MEIKVLGTGCPSCKTLFETTQQAIAELGSDATLTKEEDLLKMKQCALSEGGMSIASLCLDNVQDWPIAIFCQVAAR